MAGSLSRCVHTGGGGRVSLKACSYWWRWSGLSQGVFISVVMAGSLLRRVYIGGEAGSLSQGMFISVGMSLCSGMFMTLHTQVSKSSNRMMTITQILGIDAVVEIIETCVFDMILMILWYVFAFGMILYVGMIISVCLTLFSQFARCDMIVFVCLT